MSNIDTAWDRTKKYDFLRVERQFNHPIRKLILENAIGNTVGDFGCASCIDYPRWKEAGFKYTGIDFTEKFLNYAKKLYPEIRLLHRDASDTGLRDRCFDTSFCKDLLEHLPPRKYVSVLNEMWRLTSKVMMVAFYFSPKDKPTRYELVKNLHYKNRYNKQEILDAINRLNPKSVEVYENIGYNNSALYVMKKHEAP